MEYRKHWLNDQMYLSLFFLLFFFLSFFELCDKLVHEGIFILIIEQLIHSLSELMDVSSDGLVNASCSLVGFIKLVCDVLLQSIALLGDLMNIIFQIVDLKFDTIKWSVDRFSNVINLTDPNVSPST